VTLTESKLNELWKQPPTAFEGDLAVFMAISDELREELKKRHAGILDHMLAERCASLYAHIRSREGKTNATGKQAAFANDRAYKETQALLISTIENLQRRWLREDQLAADETLKAALVAAVNDALLDVDPKVAKAIRDDVANALEGVGA
jgi:hypothetical protein